MSRFEITYLIDSAHSKEIIEAIRVEQTIEYPLELAPAGCNNEKIWSIYNICISQISNCSRHRFKRKSYRLDDYGFKSSEPARRQVR